jgi:glutamate mutase epsilon subunit
MSEDNTAIKNATRLARYDKVRDVAVTARSIHTDALMLPPNEDDDAPAGLEVYAGLAAFAIAFRRYVFHAEETCGCQACKAMATALRKAETVANDVGEHLAKEHIEYRQNTTRALSDVDAILDSIFSSQGDPNP